MITIFLSNELGLLSEMADFKAGTGNVQDDPERLFARESKGTCSQNEGGMPKEPKSQFRGVPTG